MNLRRYPDALTHLEVLRNRTPEDGELLFLTGQCQQAEGQTADALNQHLRAIEHASGEVDYYAQLLALINTNPDELPFREDLAELDVKDSFKQIFPIREESMDAEIVAEQLLEIMVMEGQPTYRALLVRATYRKNRGLLKQAGEDIDLALLEAGENPDVLLMAIDLQRTWAQTAHQEVRPKEADDHLEKAR